MDLNSLYSQVIKTEDNLLGGIHNLIDQRLGDSMNQHNAVQLPSNVVQEGVEQQRGIKRSRKEKGSSAKERTSKIPPCPPGKRSSIYRGVTRHRWTGRYEAHLWDKSTWNPTQKKKGKQVYLGAYDDEEAAAKAYDLAALKYWGPTTLINFPVSNYTKELEEMQHVTREEYLACIRRKSSGFSRGVSKYRGVARHHHNGRWEARIGRVFGNKYLYLGTYSTQEEAAAAYDMAAIEYRGLNAVTNFDLSRYIRWLRPNQTPTSDDQPGLINPEHHSKLDHIIANSLSSSSNPSTPTPPPLQLPSRLINPDQSETHNLNLNSVENYYIDHSHPHQAPSPHNLWQQPSQPTFQFPQSSGFSSHHAINTPSTTTSQKSSSPTALSLLLQSSMFRQMLEKASTTHQLIDMQQQQQSIEMQQQQMSVDSMTYNDFLSATEDAQDNDHHERMNYRDLVCSDHMIYKDLRSESEPETVFTYSAENAPFVHATVQCDEDEGSSMEGGNANSIWSAFGTSLNLLPLTNAISSC